MSRTTISLYRERGQSMVEFAIALPVLTFFLVALLFFGRYFMVAQVILHAAQEGAKVASRTPNLNDQDTRDLVRGFNIGGSGTNPNSVIYRALGSARLLSQQTTGDLPPGAGILIMPFDNDDGTTPPGAVSVKISYPFELWGNPFNPGSSQDIKIGFTPAGGGTPFAFHNFTIVEQAVAADEIYQAQAN